ncbi:MAG: MarR family transcriptional regulator [Lactobacillaceae bacterium]|jgi:DNA-binding MarR family transcriptional regulator|nr:MarR family transcriptional regulator [Lactobacillaceae bacterium]
MKDNIELKISDLIREHHVREQFLLHQELQKFGDVSVQQAATLQMIAAHPGMIQKDLVVIFNRRAATVSTFLKRLETAGFIRRKIPADNTRNKELYLTDKGVEFNKGFELARQKIADQMLQNLSQAEQGELQKLLIKMDVK